MAGIRHVLLDVAGTLLVKPDVPLAISEALAGNGVEVDPNAVAIEHALLSERHLAPDVTTREFYLGFNAHLLRALGIAPSTTLVNAIYEGCVSLPWVADEGAGAVAALGVPVGVVSNWGHGLRALLQSHFRFPISPIVASSEIGVRKPDPRIFSAALESAGCVAVEAVYCGDSIRLDVEPAAALGIQTALLDRHDAFPAHPGARVRDLTEFASWVTSLEKSAGPRG